MNISNEESNRSSDSSGSSQSNSSYSSSEADENAKKKIRGNKVWRQELKNYSPKCDADCGLYLFGTLFVLFVAFGAPILITGLTVQEIVMDYTNCPTKKCNLTFTLTKKIPKPSYLYYEISNFYGNQRDYVSSKIIKQLSGELHVNSRDNNECKGAKYVYEMFDNDTSKYFTFTGKPLNATDYANPCGLIAKAMFNDTDFILTNSQGEEIKIFENLITNSYDRKYFYKRIANASQVQWIDVENEHFINWMQMESLDVFRKLWGRIEDDLPIGSYKIELTNNWNAAGFKGKKKLVLTGSTKIGTGKFIGILLLGGSVYCLIIFFVILYCKNKHKGRVYTVKDLRWD